MFVPVAVYFEQEEWELCIKTCEEVVEKGRDARADFKVISKYVWGWARGRGNVINV